MCICGEDFFKKRIIYCIYHAWPDASENAAFYFLKKKGLADDNSRVKEYAMHVHGKEEPSYIFQSERDS